MGARAARGPSLRPSGSALVSRTHKAAEPEPEVEFDERDEELVRRVARTTNERSRPLLAGGRRRVTRVETVVSQLPPFRKMWGSWERSLACARRARNRV